MSFVSNTLQTVLTVDHGPFSQGFDIADRVLQGFGENLSRAQRKSLGTTAVLAGLTGGLVFMAGRMEQTRVAFKNLEGSEEAATKRLKELQDFAVKTPLRFDQIAEGEQLLRGMGAEARQSIPIMTALGNALAQSGRMGNFSSALLQISQIVGSGKLQGDELRILAENGVAVGPILKELGTSMGEAGRKGITAEQFIAAFIKTFGQSKAMEDQANTLFGAFSNLVDAGVRLADALGTPALKPITELTKGLTSLANIVTDLPGPIKTLLGGALLFFTGRSIVATIQTIALTKSLIKEAEGHYRAANAADAHARSLGRLGNQPGPGGRMPGGGGGGFLGGLKGLGWGLAGFGVSEGGEWMRQQGTAKGGMWGGVQADVGNVASRGGMGASIGSWGGHLGALAGLIGGMLYGNLENTFDFGGGKHAAKSDPLLEETKKTNDLLKGIDQKVGSSGATGDTSFFPAGIQAVVRAAR